VNQTLYTKNDVDISSADINDTVVYITDPNGGGWSKVHRVSHIDHKNNQIEYDGSEWEKYNENEPEIYYIVHRQAGGPSSAGAGAANPAADAAAAAAAASAAAAATAATATSAPVTGQLSAIFNRFVRKRQPAAAAGVTSSQEAYLRNIEQKANDTDAAVLTSLEAILQRAADDEAKNIEIAERILGRTKDFT